MPEDLVLVRHGQSEANIVQKRFKRDPQAAAPDGFFDRHDSEMRLSPTGRAQARAAGDWLRRNGLGTFDLYYVSPHVRTVETAATLALGGEWVIDVRWRERDWGEFGVLNQVERAERFALSQKLKDRDPSYNARNGQLLHYTRRDPVSGRIDPKIRWMRSIYPWDELMELVSRHPLLLGDDEPMGQGSPR